MFVPTVLYWTDVLFGFFGSAASNVTTGTGVSTPMRICTRLCGHVEEGRAERTNV